jgi:hypothetical protein
MKLAVWTHFSGRLRFTALNAGTDGEHRVFEATLDPITRLATLAETTDDFAGLDATDPHFFRHHFGRADFELQGHLSLPDATDPAAVLADFSQRVLFALSGRKGCCPDERNRFVFWHTVEELSHCGPLAIAFTYGPGFSLFTQPAAAPSTYNF